MHVGEQKSLNQRDAGKADARGLAHRAVSAVRTDDPVRLDIGGVVTTHHYSGASGIHAGDGMSPLD